MGERRGHRWVPERWVEADGRWVMRPGHWERGMRDRDGDGVPNRFDRHPNRPQGMGDRDRDGVPNRYDARPNNPNRS